MRMISSKIMRIQSLKQKPQSLKKLTKAGLEDSSNYMKKKSFPAKGFYDPNQFQIDSESSEEEKNIEPLVPYKEDEEEPDNQASVNLLKVDDSVKESLVKSSLKSSSKSEKNLPIIYPKKHHRKSISNQDVNASKHQERSQKESSISHEKSSLISRTIGNYLDNKSIRNTSNFGESNPGSYEDSKYDKKKVASNIDFARQLRTNSDRSSPYMGSIYSRQAKLMSPQGGYPRPYQDSSNKSSSKSIERVSQNPHSDHSMRFVNQGYNITHSNKNESNPTDHDASVHTAHNNEGRDAIMSPATNFRQLRRKIHEENDFISKGFPQKMFGPSSGMRLRPIPKSFKSSNLSKDREKARKNELGFPLTPQL
ncbi:unnamed protein product [Moneuplotes crassus]|uniref:Uncharacterized protein n=1 Tax=Euplotes crassus TaxID=5936 RepID=A0AAD1U317_EUPCR|nr:unnamed protein product [Moneuplotes crassus]